MSSITAIIPLYNKGRWIERALDSVLGQSITPLEILVVDDGSTDDGPDIVSRRQDERVRLIRQRNAGPGAARNRGIAEAKGEYVAFLDADDAWAPEFLAAALEKFNGEGRECAAASFGYSSYPGGQANSEHWRRAGLRPGTMEVGPATSVRDLLNLTAFITPCTTVCRTEIVRDLGGFYDQDRCLYGEDAFLWAKLLLNHPVSIDLRPMAHVYRDASELSGNYTAARQVEPFLQRPELVREACPEANRRLLSRFLASRAFKTAAVLSYWGDRRAASALRRRFLPHGTITTPYYWTSLAASTHLGPIAGYCIRKLKGIRR